jgi:hypothetical protein
LGHSEPSWCGKNEFTKKNKKRTEYAVRNVGTVKTSLGRYVKWVHYDGWNITFGVQRTKYDD